MLANDVSRRVHSSWQQRRAATVSTFLQLPVFFVNFAVIGGLAAQMKQIFGRPQNAAGFDRVMFSWSSHGRMLVVPCEKLRLNEQGLYSRMWCVCEVSTASLLQVPVSSTHRNSLEHFFGEGSSTRSARCGNPSRPTNTDEKMIREFVE